MIRWWFLLAAVLVVVVLIAYSQMPPVQRWRCDVCGVVFRSEADLDAHVGGAHGRCTSWWRGHRCHRPDGHLPPHRCGCELSWLR